MDRCVVDASGLRQRAAEIGMDGRGRGCQVGRAGEVADRLRESACGEKQDADLLVRFDERRVQRERALVLIQCVGSPMGG